MTSEHSRTPAAAALFCSLLHLAGCAEPVAAPGPRPNVLLVCVDALRADRLGIHGASPSPSPFLDSLAREAVVFENATSVASWTKPSVPSLLTGLYPDEHGVLDNSRRHVDALAADAVPLAGLMADHGYRTAAFVENDQLLAEMSGLDRGFSLYRDRAGDPAQVVDRFLAWSRQDAGRPWFAYLHTLDPHYPYTPDDFTIGAKDAARLRTRSLHWSQRGDLWPLVRQRINEGVMTFDEDAMRDLDLLYRYEISAVDAALGNLWKVLAHDGLLDNTMIVLTSDHGEGFFERGRIDHGYGPYQELLHIPLVIRLPGGEHGGTRRAALAQNVDVAPTILARVGIEPPASWSSKSLLPVMQGTVDEVREVALARERHGRWQLLAARDRRFSYILSEGETIAARPVAAVPASATAGTRLRAQGIFDGAHLVASTVKRMEAGDTDTEIQGPVEAVDPAARTVRVLGLTVRVADGVRFDGEGADTLTVADLQEGEVVRFHGSLAGGVFVPTKIEKPATEILEVEGVLKQVGVLPNGDARLDLGDAVVLVDPRGRWKEFPGDTPAAPAAPVTTPKGRIELLFDRDSDPREQRDIAADNPAELARLRTLAEAARLAMEAPATQDQRRAELDDDTRERLRALGYVE